MTLKKDTIEKEKLPYHHDPAIKKKIKYHENKISYNQKRGEKNSHSPNKQI